MSDTNAPKWSLADGVAECRRELHLRQRVYPTFIARGQLTQHDADKQNRAMQGTVRFLEFCANNEVRLRSLLGENKG